MTKDEVEIITYARARELIGLDAINDADFLYYLSVVLRERGEQWVKTHVETIRYNWEYVKTLL